MNHEASLFFAGLALSSSIAGTAGATGRAQWPVKLGETSSIFVPPTFGDIDGDGIPEVLTAVGNPLSAGVTRQGIYAFRRDGSEVIDGDGDPTTDGVFKRLSMSPGHSRQPVTLGELNSNSGLEILFANEGNTYAVDPTHQRIVLDIAHAYVTGNQISWLDKFVSADRLVDLDGDKFQEVVTSEVDYLVAGASEVTLRFWDHHGQELLADVTRSTTPETGFVLEPVLCRATFSEFAHAGSLDFALNMRRGELHRRRASLGGSGPDRASGEWPVYRQNNQRTGVQSARY